MSDFFAPSYWYGGGPDFSGLANAQNQYAQNNNYFADQGRTMGAVNSYSPWANTPGGFGAQTAAYAGAGAAYGRGTGGFNGGATSGDPGAEAPIMSDPGGGETAPARIPIDSSPFGTSNAGALPYFEGPGMPFGGGGFGRGGGSVSDTGTPPIGGGGTGVWPGGGVGSFFPTQSYQDPFNTPRGDGRDFAQSFAATGFTPQMQNQPAIDAVNQFAGRGTGVAPDQPYFLPPSMNPFEHAFGSLPEGGGFAGRFGFRNAGTPSEYATAPYTDIGGQTREPGQMPPGFASPYSFDNPGGALTREMRGGIGQQAPIMNASPEEGAGSFDPTAFNPQQYAPGSPFGSGAGVGGRRGGAGGLGAGTGTQMPPTQTPFFGGEGSGFGAPGSTQNGGQYGGRGGYPALVGSPNDAYGNPFIQGNSPPFAQNAGRMGGGIGLGGLDALGEGTVFRGLR